MVTYVLFIYGTFEDHEDIEFFCIDVLGGCKSISSLKYVIDNLKNFIVIFDSTEEETKLAKELVGLLDNENILFYFMFEKNDIIMSYIPETMRNLIFKPVQDILKIEVNTVFATDDEKNTLLDDILDKIEKHGIDSLTSDEKNFLDNFAK